MVTSSQPLKPQEATGQSAAGIVPWQFSLSPKTVKNLQRGLFFIDAAVMWALEPLGMTIYIYTSIAFQSAVRQI